MWDRHCIAFTWKLLLVAEEALVSGSHTTHPRWKKKPGGNGKVDAVADAFASPSAACRCLIQTHEHTHTLHPSDEGSNSGCLSCATHLSNASSYLQNKF